MESMIVSGYISEWEISVKPMKNFFTRYVFVFDVDNTLLDWSDPRVLLKDLTYTGAILRQRKHLNQYRGRRLDIPYQRPTSKPKFKLPHWLNKIFTELQSSKQCVAIFSDIPHYEMHPLFKKFGISIIINGQKINALKPLPDGLWQISSAIGVNPQQIIMIGDQRKTDGLSAFNAGAQFFNIESIRNQGWERFLQTLSMELHN
jgi:predicted HAD superfamily phosphohydrolase YqeG